MTTRCAQASQAAGEAMAGTAPTACAWIVLEHPGPWGARIFEGGALPTSVAEHLRAGSASGVTTLLARRPETRGRRAGLRAWVARSTPGGLLLREGEVHSYEDVLSWDLSAIGRGELPPFGSLRTSPIHLVCTNGARDQCCAVDGRALVTSLCGPSSPEALRDSVWECSHIGGHRFAPVMLTLPAGTVHGRLTADQAQEVISRADRGDVLLDTYRGRSGLPAPFQAAAIDARHRLDLHGIEEIDVLRVVRDRAVPVPACAPFDEDEVACEVRHRDGRAWRAVVRRETQTEPRPESCGKEPVTGASWRVTDFTPAPAWS